MNAILLMLSVTGCYTLSSLSDKYAVSRARLTQNQFTLIMSSSLAFFLLCALPLQEVYLTLTLPALLGVLLITLCKYLEFSMGATVLKSISAFELKAWLGITLFASYFTDVAYEKTISLVKLLCLLGIVIGLFLIVYSGKERKIEYKRMVLPLILYLASKYGYGLVIKVSTPHIAPSLSLLFALILVAAISFFQRKPDDKFQKGQKGILPVVAARIPNTVGMILENAVIGISLVLYSLIQPLILVTLFLISLLQKERCTPVNLIGNLLTVVGVLAFCLV